MLKQFGFLLFFLSVSFPGFTSQIAYNEQQPNYFGMAQYISQEEALALGEVRQLNNTAWKDINIEEASFGFNQRHFWFRFPLHNIHRSDTPWLLRSNYPLLDHIDVYLLADNELVQEFHSGDTFPFNQRPIEQPTFVFPLEINTDKDYFVYLHIQTTSSLQLALSLQTESDFWQTVAIENVTSAAFYAVLLSMLFYNAVIFFIVRARSYLFYIFYIASFTLLMASIHGWGYLFLWPDSPKIHELSVVLAIGPTIMFATLREWFRSRSREVMLFIIAWITILIGFSLYSGQKFGWLPINTLTEHAIEIGAVLEVLLLALGLADRINSERKARIETQAQMLDIQIKANQELDNKVRERTEELETLNDHLQTTSITDSLTQIKNRRYFDNKFSTEYRRAFRDKSWVALLVIDIDHFKLFNDNYGHQAGDMVLQAVAKGMEDVVQRPSDAVSRFGGEEFTVILPNTPKEGAYQVAERIRKHIAELHVTWQQQSLSVTVSIGLACGIPSHHKGEGLLLKQADDFLYLAKEHGRNQVVCEDNNPAVTQHQKTN
jgi:diguanylate cyclase (GGDEF)-like protein